MFAAAVDVGQSARDKGGDGAGGRVSHFQFAAGGHLVHDDADPVSSAAGGLSPRSKREYWASRKRSATILQAAVISETSDQIGQDDNAWSTGLAPQVTATAPFKHPTRKCGDHDEGSEDEMSHSAKRRRHEHRRAVGKVGGKAAKSKTDEQNKNKKKKKKKKKTKKTSV